MVSSNKNKEKNKTKEGSDMEWGWGRTWWHHLGKQDTQEMVPIWCLKKEESVKGDREWVCGPTGNSLVAMKESGCLCWAMGQAAELEPQNIRHTEKVYL